MESLSLWRTPAERFLLISSTNLTSRERGYVFAFVDLSVSRMTQQVFDEFWLIFLRGGIHVTSNKLLDFGVIGNYEFLKGIFATTYKENCKRFCR